MSQVTLDIEFYELKWWRFLFLNTVNCFWTFSYCHWANQLSSSHTNIAQYLQLPQKSASTPDRFIARAVVVTRNSKISFYRNNVNRCKCVSTYVGIGIQALKLHPFDNKNPICLCMYYRLGVMRNSKRYRNDK